MSIHLHKPLSLPATVSIIYSLKFPETESKVGLAPFPALSFAESLRNLGGEGTVGTCLH